MKANYLKIALLFFSMMLISCFSNKAIIRPHIVVKVYDSESKKPLQNVKLETNSENKIEKTSDKNGTIDIPKEEFPTGNYHSLPLADVDFLLHKEEYQSEKINYIKYFKLDNNSKREKTYVSDSVFMKKKN
ncbi:hypothetical protein [uncultured Flavobacterium sp.]|uniref:hypothetical protein n=1 Tax=uncultured Flavobacterium sp. TaxID=165435 RepID=UPI0025F5ACBF|nr:hypothetical protein [uncultured Flavobacterium sp.]